MRAINMLVLVLLFWTIHLPGSYGLSPEENVNLKVLYIEEEAIRITSPGNYFIKGSGITTTSTIMIDGMEGDFSITMEDVHIDTSHLKGVSAFKILSGSKANIRLVLQGENILKSGYGKAGLQKTGDRQTGNLWIEGEGRLIAQGGDLAAGIGGGKFTSSSNITILSGNIYAEGGNQGAGIGGGSAGSGENISISGGIIQSIGKGGGAGIGGGTSGLGKGIYISGGEITANSEDGGAGIGGGNTRIGSKISLSGGKVTATSVDGSAIGGGGSAIGVDNILNGNTMVFAKGSEHSGDLIQGFENQLIKGIVFENGQGRVYGDCTLEFSLNLKENDSLTLLPGTILNISSHCQLSNEGILVNQGEINIYGQLSSKKGILQGNGSVTIQEKGEWDEKPSNPEKLEVKVLEMPSLTGIYGMPLEEFSVSGGKVIHGNSQVSGVWRVGNRDEKEFPWVGTNQTYRLHFSPMDEFFQKVWISVNPKVEPAILKVTGVELISQNSGTNEAFLLKRITFSGLMNGDTLEQEKDFIIQSRYIEKITDVDNRMKIEVGLRANSKTNNYILPEENSKIEILLPFDKSNDENLLPSKPDQSVKGEKNHFSGKNLEKEKKKSPITSGKRIGNPVPKEFWILHWQLWAKILPIGGYLLW